MFFLNKCIIIIRTQTGKQKQRTKTVAGSLEPKWNTSFVYHPFKESDIHSKSLEVTVYDYDRIGSGEYVGEVLIDLSRANLSDKPEWYKLINQETESIASSITVHIYYSFLVYHLTSSLNQMNRVFKGEETIYHLPCRLRG